MTFSTKAMIDCLALPSFQEGSGSAAREIVGASDSMQANAAVARDRTRVVFMVTVTTRRESTAFGFVKLGRNFSDRSYEKATSSLAPWQVSGAVYEIVNGHGDRSKSI